MEVTPLVQLLGQGMSDSATEGELAVGDHANKRDRQRLLHRMDHGGKVFLSSRQQAVGQEHFGRATIAHHAEDLMTDIGLEAIEPQDDPSMGMGNLLPWEKYLWRDARVFCVECERIRLMAISAGSVHVLPTGRVPEPDPAHEGWVPGNGGLEDILGHGVDG